MRSPYSTENVISTLKNSIANASSSDLNDIAEEIDQDTIVSHATMMNGVLQVAIDNVNEGTVDFYTIFRQTSPQAQNVEKTARRLFDAAPFRIAAH
jgi:NAD kinase